MAVGDDVGAELSIDPLLPADMARKAERTGAAKVAVTRLPWIGRYQDTSACSDRRHLCAGWQIRVGARQTQRLR